MSQCVVFPAPRQAAAHAYADWTDTQFALIAPGEGRFSYEGKSITDASGNHIVAYLGTGFKLKHKDVPEPAGGATQRSFGNIAAPNWIVR
jgi:hypothetical protein